MKIEITINLEVEDTQELALAIAREYDCDVSEISHDDVWEFINNHIKAKNTCNNAFMIEGTETDGWLLQRFDASKFLDAIK